MLSKNKLLKDFLISSLLILFLSLILFFGGIEYEIDKSSISLFISIFVAILGVLFTVFAILFAFESNVRDNEAIKILKSKGKYNEIYQRFINSIKGIFYSSIVLTIIYFSFDNVSNNEFIFLSYKIIVLILVVFSLLRTYRCFYIFDLLHKVMKKYKI